MIQVKNLQVFKDNKAKVSSDLLGYKDVLTFQSFFLVEDDNSCNSEDIDICHIEVFGFIFRLGRKVKPISKVKEAKSTTG